MKSHYLKAAAANILYISLWFFSLYLKNNSWNLLMYIMFFFIYNKLKISYFTVFEHFIVGIPNTHKSRENGKISPRHPLPGFNHQHMASANLASSPPLTIPTQPGIRLKQILGIIYNQQIMYFNTTIILKTLIIP